jgi:hypothetical protein
MAGLSTQKGKMKDISGYTISVLDIKKERESVVLR